MNPPDPKRRVLLIGWDAADWKFINPLLDNGQMPNLSRLVDGGVIANLASLQPCLSPILWTSIATGKTAEKHGIAGFVEPVPGGGGIRLSSSTSRKSKAIWNILSQNGQRCTVVNWFASHPAEPIQGTCVSNQFFDGFPTDVGDPWPVVPGSVHPSSLAQVIADFRMHPGEFSVSDLARFIPKIHTINLTADRRPHLLAESLAKTVSVHAVATGAMEAEPWDFLAVYYDGLDVVGHQFMPYHPPQLANVAGQDFDLYQHVMRELYLFHDEMLGRLLELAGDETTVILLSDHGFHCDGLRPLQYLNNVSAEVEAAAWHRHYGVLAIKGPGIKPDERIYGSSLLDITPTILSLFGLPLPQDMDGRPLLEIFVQPVSEIATIPSWDNRPGLDGMHPANTQQAMVESPEMIAQLVALGYLPSETTESQRAVEIAINESKFNLAIVHSSHSRPQEAQQILTELNRSDPENPRYALALAKTYAVQRMHEQCLAILQSMDAQGHQTADSELLLAAELFNVGRADEALLKLTRTEQVYAACPALFNLIGKIHLAQRDWQAAGAAFAKCLALDEDEPHAHNGYAFAAIQMGQYQRGVEHALRAVGLVFFFPQAHFHMGMGFKGLKDLPRALRSLNLAVTQSPEFLEAHQQLANIYQQLNNVPLWMNHQRIARGLSPLE